MSGNISLSFISPSLIFFLHFLLSRWIIQFNMAVNCTQRIKFLGIDAPHTRQLIFWYRNYFFKYVIISGLSMFWCWTFLIFGLWWGVFACKLYCISFIPFTLNWTKASILHFTKRKVGLNIFMYVRNMHIHISLFWTGMHVLMFICMYESTYVCMYACIIFLCKHVLCMYVCIYVSMQYMHGCMLFICM